MSLLNASRSSRKNLPEEIRRDTRVVVKLRLHEARLLRRLAARESLPVSTYLRHLLRQAGLEAGLAGDPLGLRSEAFEEPPPDVNVDEALPEPAGPFPSREPRRYFLRVRLTEAELHAFTEAAKRVRRTVSAHVRHVLGIPPVTDL